MRHQQPLSRVSTARQFSFGENWLSFVRAGVDRSRIDAAVDSLRQLLGRQDLHGCVFLDVGCGSGLFSFAAGELGAERVVAFDADPNAVAAALELRSQCTAADRWQVLQGSILDASFVESLPRADVVYAWGMLHSTGAMWRAIDITADRVKPGGQLVVAIYNEVGGWLGSSRQWLAVKRFYNGAPPALRTALEYAYMGQRALRDLIMLRNPRQRWTLRGRGMRYRHDVRDWLGGLPYEYAPAEAVIEHVRGRLGFEVCYRSILPGHQCNEFTFRRPLPV